MHNGYLRKFKENLFLTTPHLIVIPFCRWKTGICRTAEIDEGSFETSLFVNTLFILTAKDILKEILNEQ